MNRSENQTIRRFIFSTLLFPQLQTLHRFLYKRWIEKRFWVVVLDSLGIEALVKAADHTFDAGLPGHGYTANGIVLFRVRIVGPLKQGRIFLTGQLKDRFVSRLFVCAKDLHALNDRGHVIFHCLSVSVAKRFAHSLRHTGVGHLEIEKIGELAKADLLEIVYIGRIDGHAVDQALLHRRSSAWYAA